MWNEGDRQWGSARTALSSELRGRWVLQRTAEEPYSGSYWRRDLEAVFQTFYRRLRGSIEDLAVFKAMRDDLPFEEIVIPVKAARGERTGHVVLARSTIPLPLPRSSAPAPIATMNNDTGRCSTFLTRDCSAKAGRSGTKHPPFLPGAMTRRADPRPTLSRSQRTTTLISQGQS